MICKMCRKIIPDVSLVCPKCGAQLGVNTNGEKKGADIRLSAAKPVFKAVDFSDRGRNTASKGFPPENVSLKEMKKPETGNDLPPEKVETSNPLSVDKTSYKEESEHKVLVASANETSRGGKKKSFSLPEGKIYILIASVAALVVVAAIVVGAVLSTRPAGKDTENSDMPADSAPVMAESTESLPNQGETLVENKERGDTIVLEGQEAVAIQELDRYENALYPLASSSYPQDRENTYLPENVLDGSLQTAWVEDGEEGAKGEWIQLNLPEDMWIVGIRIVNGYMKNEDILKRNCQVRGATLQFSDDNSVDLALKKMEYEENARGEIFLFPMPVFTGYVRLVINEIYEGEPSNGKDAFTDTAISEIAVLTEEEYDWSERWDEADSKYILDDSNQRFLSEDELKNLSKEELRLARNEIYARYGRKFDDEALCSYFESCSWYEGTIEAEDFQEDWLNEYEAYNRDLIISYEEKMGYR